MSSIKSSWPTLVLILIVGVVLFFFKGCKSHSELLKADIPVNCKLMMECGYYFEKKAASGCILAFAKGCSASNASKACAVETAEQYKKLEGATKREEHEAFKACRNLRL